MKLTDDQATKAGLEIAAMLGLRTHRRDVRGALYPSPRFHTTWGDKTPQGLARSLQRILEESAQDPAQDPATTATATATV